MGVDGVMAAAKTRAQSGSIYVSASGKRLGIDASVWLYQIYAGTRKDVRGPIDAACVARMTRQAMSRARRLHQTGVKIVLVFDCPFTSPAKEVERARRRAARARRCAAEFDADAAAEFDDETDSGAAGPSSLRADEEAVPFDVHGALQASVWDAAHAAGFTCIMSPAEADHQLAWMCADGSLDGVVTVDSDLLVLGVLELWTNVKYDDGASNRIVLARMFEPLAGQNPGWPDPCAWLVDTPRGLQHAALMAYSLIVPSDFNRVPGIGRVTARDLVIGTVQAARGQSRDFPPLCALDGGTSDEQYVVFLRAFAVNVHGAHAARAGGALALGQDVVLLGMLRAFTVFRRSIVFDTRLGVERPLTGPLQLTSDEEALVGKICSDRAQARQLAFGHRSRGATTHAPVDRPAAYTHRAVPGVAEPLVITYPMLPIETCKIFELSEWLVRLACDHGMPAIVGKFPKGIYKAHLLTFFRCVSESGYSDKNVDVLQYAACLWLGANRKPLDPASDDDDAASDADDDADDGNGDGEAPPTLGAAPGPSALPASNRAAVRQSDDRRPRWAFPHCMLRDPSGMAALAVHLRQGRVVPPGLRDTRNSGELAVPLENSEGWLGGYEQWALTGINSPPSGDASVISRHYCEMHVRGVVPDRDDSDPLDMCRPMKRALQRVLRMSHKPTIRVHRVIRRNGLFVAFIAGDVPASQTSGVMYSCTLCVECVPVFHEASVLAGQPVAREGGAETSASAIAWSLSRVLWVECPCKQKWKCAHGGSLLWILTLWCTARRENHRDRQRIGLLAHNAWWLGLSQDALAAHEVQTRCVPAYLLDMSGMLREGEMPAPGSEMGPQRRARHEYHPLHKQGTPSEVYPRFKEFSTASVDKLYAAFNSALHAQAAGGERVGMCAHQFAYARGGEWLLSDAAQRAANFPVGSRAGDLMRAHEERHAALVLAARQARLDALGRRRGRRAST